jgi:hypothetical protein
MVTSRIPVNPGQVEWSGDNPGIYLKRLADGPFTALALFFRVVLSPHGRGTVMLVLGDPDVPAGWPNARNLCISDNQSLCRYLIDGFVANMPSFRGQVGLPHARYLPLTAARTLGSTDARYAEVVECDTLVAEMAWEQLGTPFAVEATKEQSSTGTHDMVSIFLEARAAQVTLAGQRLEGQVADRQLFGRTISTAFLAFSETWIQPA